MKTGLKIIVLLAAVLAVDTVFGQGCSQCRLGAEQASGHGGLDESSFGNNLNYGILYLMAIPYILLMIFFRKRIISGFKNLIGK